MTVDDLALDVLRAVDVDGDGELEIVAVPVEVADDGRCQLW